MAELSALLRKVLSVTLPGTSLSCPHCGDEETEVWRTLVTRFSLSASERLYLYFLLPPPPTVAYGVLHLEASSPVNGLVGASACRGWGQRALLAASRAHLPIGHSKPGARALETFRGL